MKITPYLVFNGQAEEAATFYADVFGGRIENLHRYADFPPMPGCEIPDGYGRKIGHCCILFPGGSMSVADTLPADPRTFGNGNIITLSVGSVEKAEAAFGHLSAGAQKIGCPMGETFYAKRYGELVDRFGVMWAVMYEEK